MTHSAMMMPGPQRMRALERANEVRLARAELKRRIAEGEISAATVILKAPWEARSWPVGDLLMSQRRWGSIRCRKFLLRNQINEKKPIGTLTDRQRNLLADQLASCETRELASLETRELAPCETREVAPFETRELASLDTRELELVGV